ncbi:MAG TPA: NADH-quinone oxidoreductase subunit N [Acidimicrobiales bacterium]|nr:NADH-quinone oxidoreductase subunit N [Acidimicrobiales bacterium]
MSGRLLVAQATTLDLPNVEYSRFLPILILIGGALGILVLASLIGGRVAEGWWTSLSVATAGAAIAASCWLWNDIQRDGPGTAVSDALRIDGFSVWFSLVICSAVLLFSLMADGYVQRERLGGPEIHVLALLSASGGLLMAFANDLLVLFLGLEILSIALYVMAGFHRRRDESGEAAMKYFVLGAFSSAIFLYGVALTYGATGSTRLDQVNRLLTSLRSADGDRNLALAGMALMIVGLGFKVAAVPFHTWTPDVYQGSPSPVTGFMAAAAKAAGFAGLIRVLIFGLQPLREDWRPAIWALAVLTLVVGSVLAIVQTDVKRMLAYSSINHAGYVLVGLHANNVDGVAGAQYYLLTYAFTVLGSFAVVSVVARRGDGSTSIEDYRGLYFRKPLLAVAFTLLLAAQAGVPLTTGFLAKFSVIRAATTEGDYSLGIIAMLVTAVAAFFYLRLIVTMYAAPEGVDAEHPDSAGGVAVLTQERTGLKVMPATAAVIAVSVAMTVGAGLWAGPLLDFAKRATIFFPS